MLLQKTEFAQDAALAVWGQVRRSLDPLEAETAAAIFYRREPRALAGGDMRPERKWGRLGAPALILRSKQV